MASCDDLESAILDRAAGTLPAGESESLQAHLDGCARCRAWLLSCEEAVRRVALPPPSEEELRLFAQLPSRARAAFRERRQRSMWGRPLIGLLSAAAVAGLVMVAWPRGTRPTAAVEAAWAEQDSSELEAWALSDPLEEPDEAMDEGLAELGDAPDLDLDSESME